MSMRRIYLLAAIAAAAGGAGVALWRERQAGSPDGGLASAPDTDTVRLRAPSRAVVDPSDVAVSQLFALELTGADGQPMPMSQFRGRRLVVNFWATWCAPCIEEMPELSALATELASDKLAFVGIAIDQAANVARFAQKVPVSYPLAVAGAAGLGLVTALGNPQGGLPFTVVVEPDGAIRERYLGKVAMADLRQVLTS